MTGAPYGMTSEWRRKQRYAILSGLHLAGFEPSDPEHIGFVEFDAGDILEQTAKTLNELGMTL